MSDDGKDPRRVEAGKKAAQTRKEREGEDVFKEMGAKGGSSSGSSRGGSDDSQQMSSSGSGSGSGSESESGMSHDEMVHEHRVEGGKKAAETRKAQEGDDVFQKMGQAGAEARWGGKKDDDTQ